MPERKNARRSTACNDKKYYYSCHFLFDLSFVFNRHRLLSISIVSFSIAARPYWLPWMLFTNITHEDGIDACRKFLKQRSTYKPPTADIVKLIDLVLNLNCFALKLSSYCRYSYGHSFSIARSLSISYLPDQGVLGCYMVHHVTVLNLSHCACCFTCMSKSCIVARIYFGPFRVGDIHVNKYWSIKTLYHGLWAWSTLTRDCFRAIRAFFFNVHLQALRTTGTRCVRSAIWP